MYRYMVDIENEQTGEIVCWLGGADSPSSALIKAMSAHSTILYNLETKNWPPNLNIKIRRDVLAGRS